MKVSGISIVDAKGVERFLEDHGCSYYGTLGTSFNKDSRKGKVFDSDKQAEAFVKELTAQANTRLKQLEKKRKKCKKAKSNYWDTSQSHKLQRISHEKSKINKLIKQLKTAHAGDIDVPLTLYKKTRKLNVVNVPKNKNAHTCNFCGVKLIGIKYVNMSYDTKVCPLCIDRCMNELKPEFDKIGDDVKQEYKAAMFLKAL